MSSSGMPNQLHISRYTESAMSSSPNQLSLPICRYAELFLAANPSIEDPKA